jgi:hypothetical protein
MALHAAQLGAFGIFPQTTAGSEPSGSEYYWFRANAVEVGPQQIMRDLGALVGGSLLGEGQIKTGAFSGGRVVMPPPLEANLGWLFHAFAGGVVSTDMTGYYNHYFPSDTAGDTAAPDKLVCIHKIVDLDTDLGEVLLDQTVARIQLNIAGGEYVSLQADFMGSEPSSTTVTGVGWTPAPETAESVPIACKGSFELPDGTAIDTVQGVTIDMVNVIPGIRDVMRVGNYFPHSFPVLGRVITVTWNHLVEAKTLYESIFYDTGTWTPVVYNTDFAVSVESADDISGQAVPYLLEFMAESVDWTATPIPLAGGDLVRLQVVGSVADAGTAGVDWYLLLQNEETAYTWPT